VREGADSGTPILYLAGGPGNDALYLRRLGAPCDGVDLGRAAARPGGRLARARRVFRQTELPPASSPRSVALHDRGVTTVTPPVPGGVSPGDHHNRVANSNMCGAFRPYFPREDDPYKQEHHEQVAVCRSNPCARRGSCPPFNHNDAPQVDPNGTGGGVTG